MGCKDPKYNKGASQNGIITEFEGPYRINCTPYYKIEFSEATKNFCAENCTLLFENDLNSCKAIVVGDSCVGKTSMVNRFSMKIFDNNYKATIGVDFEVEKFTILEVPFIVQIWDTAGQERFKSIAQSYYRGAHVIMLVFDFTNLTSLSHCKMWLHESLKACGYMLPYIFLIGTKKDLLPQHVYIEVEINAIAAAKSLNAEFWPISSKTGENVDKLFRRIASLTFDDCIKQGSASSETRITGYNLIPLKPNALMPQTKTGCDCQII